MSISLTIRSGTTRTYPQQGDEGLYSEATNWAVDATNALNDSYAKDGTIAADAVVGNTDDVTNGLAGYTTLTAALAAVSNGDTILLLDRTFTPAAQIDVNKKVTIIGKSNSAIIASDNIAADTTILVSVNDVTLKNFQITQGTGSPTYAIEIDSGIERTNISVTVDGTYATGKIYNNSGSNNIVATVNYDSDSELHIGDIITDQGDSQWTVKDNDSNALQIGSSGALDLLTLDTTNGSETVKVNGDLEVSGDISLDQIKLRDTDESNTLELKWNEDDTSDRTFNYAVNGGDRTLDLSENLTVADGNNITLTAEDNDTSVVMDNANFEVESSDASQRNFKITSAKAGNTTLTMQEDLTIGDGADVTITAEDAAGSITLDNCSIEVEDTVGSGNTIKFITATDDASRTVTLSENLTIGDGADVTLTAEDASGSVTLDNCSFEVEDTVGSGNTIKIANATDDASRTITLSEDLTIGDGANISITAEDANTSIVIDNANFEVENTDLTQRDIKITSSKAGNTTLTFEENLTVADGNDISITAEDASTSIVMDNVNFEVESSDASQRDIKITSSKAGNTTITLADDITFGGAVSTAGALTISNNDATFDFSAASKTLTVEDDSAINQDVTSDADVAFNTVTCTTDIDTPLVTNDSADLSLTTTTSGDINLDVATPGTDNVRISSGSDTSATTNQILFGDDTGGVTGLRNNSGQIEWNDSGAGWNALATAVGANTALSNLASVAINTSLISDTDNTDDLGSDAIEWKDLWAYAIKHDSAGTPDLEISTEGNNGNINMTPEGTGLVTVEGGAGWMKNNHLLNADDFPDTTSLYGWNAFAQGTLANADWIGSEDLVAVGTMAYASDHLGIANNAMDLDGSTIAAYVNSATFDTADESFSISVWINHDDAPALAEYYISKTGAANANKSFFLGRISSGGLIFRVYYDAGGNFIDVRKDYNDNYQNNWSHFAAVYDAATNSMAIYENGNCIGYKIDSNLATRNNSSGADLTIGAQDGSGTPANILDGQIADVFYKKDVLTANEIRAIYASGSRKPCFKDGNGKISINDGRKNNGEYYVYPTADVTVTATAVGTAATGYQIHIPETSKYKVKAVLHMNADDASGTTTVQQFYARMVDGVAGTTEIDGAYASVINDATIGGGGSIDPLTIIQQSIEKIIYANKDDIINIEAWKSSSTSTAVLEYSNGFYEPYIMWEKLD